MGGAGGYSVTENTQSPKICLNFNFGGAGGYSVTENTQSPKICLNFNFLGGKGVFCNWKYSKSQDLPKFQFFGGGYSVTENTQSPKICLNFNFQGGGYSVTENTQSPKICLNFNFRGGGGILFYRIGVFCRICTKFSTTPAGSCITDSLSHTTYVETKWSCKGYVLTHVCPSFCSWGVCLSACWDTTPQTRHPQTRHPLGPGTPPGTRHLPLCRRLLLRTLRILLECILVHKVFLLDSFRLGKCRDETSELKQKRGKMLLFQKMTERSNNGCIMSWPCFLNFHICKCKFKNFLVSKQNWSKRKTP